MENQFDYYYIQEAEQFTFYRIPKQLFTDPAFKTMSVESKVLYGLMLDRMSLSRRSGWIDEQDRVFIYFTMADIQQQLGCGHNKAVRLLKELDRDMGMIRRKHQGLGKPDKIYVMNFISVRQPQPSENGNSEQENSQPSESGNSEAPETGDPEFPESDANKNDDNNTDFSDTDSIYPLSKSKENPLDGWRMGEEITARSILHEKWGYVALEGHYPRNVLRGIFALGVDVLCSKAPTLRVCGEDMPRQQVVDRLLSLDFTHIDYVLDSMSKVSRPVRNVKSYLLTALYTAPTTLDAYIETLFAANERQKP